MISPTVPCFMNDRKENPGRKKYKANLLNPVIAD